MASIRFPKLGVPLLKERILQWQFESILKCKISKSGTLAYSGTATFQSSCLHFSQIFTKFSWFALFVCFCGRPLSKDSGYPSYQIWNVLITHSNKDKVHFKDL